MIHYEPLTHPPGGLLPVPGIPSSADVAGIELRMLPPFIHDNHTLRFWPFPGRAHLYCLTLVVSDAANQLRGNIDLNAFPRVGCGEVLPINKTIFYWEDDDDEPEGKAPAQVHTLCSVIKSKEALRDAGEVLRRARDDREYQDLVGKLQDLAGDAASMFTVSDLTLQIARVVGSYLGRVDDRPLGTVVQSFTCLHGDWDRLGITPITRKAADVDFQFELVIRDRTRKGFPAAASGVTLPLTAEVAPGLQPL